MTSCGLERGPVAAAGRISRCGAVGVGERVAGRGRADAVVRAGEQQQRQVRGPGRGRSRRPGPRTSGRSPPGPGAAPARGRTRRPRAGRAGWPRRSRWPPPRARRPRCPRARTCAVAVCLPAGLGRCADGAEQGEVGDLLRVGRELRTTGFPSSARRPPPTRRRGRRSARRGRRRGPDAMSPARPSGPHQPSRAGPRCRSASASTWGW